MNDLLSELLSDKKIWWRIAEKSWENPLDPNFAQAKGGRWNPPNSFPCLYLNEDTHTAHFNLRRFISKWPYQPEDLRPDNAPNLVGVSLPKRQKVCDAHSSAGIQALGLPKSYPLDATGKPVDYARCQPLGQRIKSLALQGVLCRSAQSNHCSDRELAWFPSTARSHASLVKTLPFDEWYWVRNIPARF